jgi:hypothetical protein
VRREVSDQAHGYAFTTIQPVMQIGVVNYVQETALKRFNLTHRLIARLIMVLAKATHSATPLSESGQPDRPVHKGLQAHAPRRSSRHSTPVGCQRERLWHTTTSVNDRRTRAVAQNFQAACNRGDRMHLACKVHCCDTL